MITATTYPKDGAHMQGLVATYSMDGDLHVWDITSTIMSSTLYNQIRTVQSCSNTQTHAFMEQ